MKEPQPKDHSQGWWFPNSLVRLYEEQLLSGEELVLLGKIMALQDPKAGGCWASNAWLAKWSGKSISQVSRLVSRFEEEGWVVVNLKNFNQRIIRVILSPYAKMPRHPTQKCVAPLRKNAHIVSTSREEQERYSADAEIGFFLTPKTKSKLRQLCERFDEFVYRVRWRAKDDAKPILGNWVIACEELIGRLEGDYGRFEELVEWYMENYKNPYTKNHSAMTTLCRNFFGLEKAMCRETNQPVPEIKVKKTPVKWEDIKAVKSCEIEEIPE